MHAFAQVIRPPAVFWGRRAVASGGALGDSRPMPDDGRLRVFAHTNAEKADLYRAILRAFVDAKRRFALHLRPPEVREALARAGRSEPPEAVEAALRQLAQWGNLDASPDTADVATVEDFYRERLLYQISRRGEAAEQALAVFEERIRHPGELQTAALADIRERLLELERLAAAPPDPGKAHAVLRDLFARFAGLTDKAQVFLSGLQRSIDLHGSDEDVLLQYKEQLIDYLQRFIDELIVSGLEIAQALERIEARGIEPHLDAAARREVGDRIDHDEEVEVEERRRWRERWAGLGRWFRGTARQPSQADVLRARTRAAIPALLAAIESMHDRRIRRSDRAADWRTLARWFAEAPSDADLHRLYRVAFALSPARHLRTNAESLEALDERMVDTQASWLDEPTLRITPRLRTKGRYGRPGRERKVERRAEARDRLAALAEEETRQLERARASLLCERTRLSELGPLDAGAFDLFLDLLAQALSAQPHPDAPVEVTSADGSLAVRLEPVGDGAQATVETARGSLTGPDAWIEVRDALALAEAAE
jgi:uncharacterized protein (TIGR02677 family)